MTDLTDSFCERCGARYAFVANAPKGLSLKGARVLARGLKNFVFTDGQSIADSMELARNEDDHETSTRIVAAFHSTFNFCMSCRQYACDRCWNAVAGACLSCAPAPEVESAASDGGRPVSRPLAAEELPILRGSTGQPEAEWSLFSEAPVADPDRSASGTASFYEPTVYGEWRPERPPQPPAPPAWPAADLTDSPNATTAGSNGKNAKNGHDSSHKRVDRDAVRAWPVADEIAPEMLLTPEELEIVEAHLGQASPKGSPTAEDATSEAEAAPQAPLLAELRTWWNSTEPDQDEPASPDWSLDDSAAEDRPAGDWELAAAPSGFTPAEVTEPVEESVEEWADEPSNRETDLPPLSPKLLRRTPTSESLPPLTPPEPRPQPHEPGGLVARLFGRRAQESDPSSAPRPRRASSRRGQPADESWPHATAWSERSLEGRHWWQDAATPASESGAQPDDQVVAPGAFEARPVGTLEPAAERPPEPRRTVQPKARTEPAGRRARSAPVPARSAPVEIDPRAAAALRLSAVEGAMGPAAAPQVQSDAAPKGPRAAAEQAAPSPAGGSAAGAEPSFDLPVAAPPRRLAAAYEPAWLRVQREAAEPEPDRSHEVPEEVLADDSAEAPETEEPAVAQMPAAPARAAQAPASPAPAAQPEAPRTETKTLAAPPQATSDMPALAPATPWPPLGASWPTREKPGAPWPAPDTTPVPAVVAAAQVPAPTVAEMWVQSAQEVLNRGSVRVCHHCALPVSTRARFCRRCGTQQV